jgi:ribose-phosphate pyrophosphokinase
MPVAVGDGLARALAKELKARHVAIEQRVFPDGEILPRLTAKPRGTVILALSKARTESVNDYLLKFLLLANKLREVRGRLIGVLPYLPYARQDKAFRPGEPISSKYIAKLLSANLDHFITVSAHEHRQTVKELFKIPAENISGFRPLARAFMIRRPYVVGPDIESLKYIREFASVLGCDFTCFRKARDIRTGEVRISAPAIDLAGRNVIIADDIVSSGRTLVQAAAIARRAGAKSIYFAFVHAVLAPGALARLRAAKPAKIVATSTIESPVSKVDISGEIADYLKGIL